MLIPGRPKVSTRFTTTRPATPLAHGFTPRWSWWTTVAAMRPNTAPEAPTVNAVGSIIITPRAPPASDPRYRPRKRVGP